MKSVTPAVRSSPAELLVVCALWDAPAGILQPKCAEQTLKNGAAEAFTGPGHFSSMNTVHTEIVLRLSMGLGLDWEVFESNHILDQV